MELEVMAVGMVEGMGIVPQSSTGYTTPPLLLLPAEPPIRDPAIRDPVLPAKSHAFTTLLAPPAPPVPLVPPANGGADDVFADLEDIQTIGPLVDFFGDIARTARHCAATDIGMPMDRETRN